ncbi:hypothetical protein, partial [Knoellia aerolata]|uniref:hypothetical protein n=1 Tax=Knoellia aerolata TaxID=442954 RepID=UPI00055EDEB6
PVLGEGWSPPPPDDILDRFDDLDEPVDPYPDGYLPDELPPLELLRIPTDPIPDPPDEWCTARDVTTAA